MPSVLGHFRGLTQCAADRAVEVASELLLEQQFSLRQLAVDKPLFALIEIRAANTLDIDYKTLLTKLKKYGFATCTSLHVTHQHAFYGKVDGSVSLIRLVEPGQANKPDGPEQLGNERMTRTDRGGLLAG